MNNFLPPSNVEGLEWMAAFGLWGCVVGWAFSSVIIAARRGRFRIIAAFGALLTLSVICTIPMRMLQNFTEYHSIYLRESLWPYGWGIIYSTFVGTVSAYLADRAQPDPPKGSPDSAQFDESA